jgi:hypothetical protein
MAGNKNSGRRPYRPTDENREKVRVLKAGGMSHEAIATAIGVTLPTLAKHFQLELDCGTAKVRADLLMAQYRSAMGGNVSAQTKMLEAVGASAADEKMKEIEEQHVKAVKLGKKEEQQIAAENVDGMFAPPSGPKLVVSNSK